MATDKLRCGVLLCAFLLVAAGVAAQPITATLAGIDSAALAATRTPYGGTALLTDDVRYRAINIALAATCALYPAYFVEDTLLVTKDSTGYSLNYDVVQVSWVKRKLLDTAEFFLSELPTDSATGLPRIEDLYVHDPADPTSPQWYLVRGRRVFLYPHYQLSSATDTFLVGYYALHPQLTKDTSSVLIPYKYLVKVVQRAAAEYSLIRGDYATAQQWMALFGEQFALEGRKR